MTRDATSIIVQCGPGSQALVRTADSVIRQTPPAIEIFLAACATPSLPSLAESTALRIGARVVIASNISRAMNDSVARARGEYVAVIPSGFRLHPSCIGLCGDVLANDPSVLAVVPSVRFQSADGLYASPPNPPGATFVDLIADPRNTPPVLVLRRSTWETVGGLDESLECLADYDLRLRLASSGVIVAIDDLASSEIGQEFWRPLIDTPAYLAELRTVLEKHRMSMQDHMTEILVRCEVRFGGLRDAHRALVQRRDDDLAELERLRAAAAHGRAWLAHHGHDALDWGDLRRTNPVSREWGYDRGVPVDRYHIEAFLAACSSDIKGAVLEVQEDDFTRRFGGKRVVTVDVVDVDDANPRAALTADLRCAPHIASSRYDCIILTQTLHVIDDAPAAIRECWRMLKPGGVLLATLPSASRVCLEYGEHGDFWRVTPAGARSLFEREFGPGQVDSTGYGNVLTSVAFLEGLATAELTEAELEGIDAYYPSIVGVHAVKRSPEMLRARRHRVRGTVLLYHRVSDCSDVYGLGISPSRFADHLAWLKTHCHVMPLEDLLGHPADDLRDGSVAVTFDDGYLDNLLHAAPMLEREGVPATFFLTTRWLENPGEYWWDAIERALLGDRPLPPILRVELAGRPLELSIDTPQQRAAAHRQLHDLLVRASLEARDRAVAALLDWTGRDAPRHRPMLADEARALQRVPGASIGAHSINHLALPDQPMDVRRREIEGSREALEKVLGRRVTEFAYPYGALDKTTVDTVRSAWRWGIACGECPVGRSFDAGCVPRLEVKDWDVTTLAARLEEKMGSHIRGPSSG